MIPNEVSVEALLTGLEDAAPAELRTRKTPSGSDVAIQFQENPPPPSCSAGGRSSAVPRFPGHIRDEGDTQPHMHSASSGDPTPAHQRRDQTDLLASRDYNNHNRKYEPPRLPVVRKGRGDRAEVVTVARRLRGHAARGPSVIATAGNWRTLGPLDAATLDPVQLASMTR
ncbi:hypothetical protein HPB47_008407 [Ixodes persulcatus]|uniref:Uncharacterized protein n=1 Tax=Ixodes persulcatus TaxID=34615 RepID=A0AC60P4W4_IXOPE|nr:hypothetical protein HPB47_008407 [Ixodes persulcatus]